MATENPFIKIPPHKHSPRKMNPIFGVVSECPGGIVYFDDPQSFEKAIELIGTEIKIRVACPGNCQGEVSFTIAGTID